MSLYCFQRLILDHLRRSCFLWLRLPNNDSVIELVHMDEPRRMLLMITLEQCDLFERDRFGVDPGVRVIELDHV